MSASVLNTLPQRGSFWYSHPVGCAPGIPAGVCPPAGVACAADGAVEAAGVALAGVAIGAAAGVPVAGVAVKSSIVFLPCLSGYFASAAFVSFLN